MEALLVSLMERLSGELRELKESFNELKAENAVLRKEILGIGASEASSGEQGMGLMEKTTLRELVEEIQFDVKALNAKVERSLREDKDSVNGNKPFREKRGDQHLHSADNDVDKTEQSVQRFPVVEIKFKTIAEQREWIKKTIAESVTQRLVLKGASFGGRTPETIYTSNVPNPTKKSTSCTIKLSNHSSYALKDPRFYFWNGIRTHRPSKVDPGVSEVFSFQSHKSWSQCMFLYSFGISSSLRLTIYSNTINDGSIQFGMAFTPQDVPTDQNLLDKFMNPSSAPDVWMDTRYNKEPREVIINHGKLVARGNMTPGPFSVIHIDMVEVSDTEAVALRIPPKMKPLEDGESMRASWTSSNLLHGSSLDKITCNIEIGNCLSCNLRNPSGFFCNNADNSLPPEILPFNREKFITSADKTLEAIFSYEIESTDLCLVVALRAESGNNSFGVAFAPLPDKANRHKLEALMGPKAWKIHEYKKYAHAKDGEQVIETRNIRASVKMTEDAESLLKILVFAFE